MSITQIGGTVGNLSLQLLESLVTRTTPQSGRRAANANAGKINGFYTKLDEIAQTSPDEFKQLTLQIAHEIDAAARNADADSQRCLQLLAGKFALSSRRGDTAALAPQNLPPGHVAGHGPSPDYGNRAELAVTISNAEAHTPQDAGPDVSGTFADIYQQIQDA